MELPEQIMQRLEGTAPRTRFLVALVLVGLVAFVDAITGAILALSVFYLLPVALATSSKMVGFGYLTALAAAATSVAGAIVGDPEQAPIYLLNGAFRLALFAIAVALLHRLRQALERERGLARTDALTGLPNRRHLEDVAAHELRRARRTGRDVTIAYVDLDGFKLVNDRLGHAQGDEVLRVTGRTLATNVRAADVVARLGGDEFAVLLLDADPLTRGATVKRFAGALNAALASWGVSATVGTASSTQDTVSVAELLVDADRDMYAAKALIPRTPS